MASSLQVMLGGKEGAVEARRRHRAALLGSLAVLPLVVAAPRTQVSPPSSPMTRAEREEFLLKAAIVSEPRLAPGVRRVSLADGQREHDASLETSTSDDPSRWGYRSNVAAYELDKALDLDLVSPSVERTVNGRSAALTWWVDDVLMDELSRRRRGIAPPDLERWTQQMQAVRVFDELIANAYRSMSPASYTSTLWDNLLITREWEIRLIDHVRAFGTSRQLAYPESLTRCDRALLAGLRALNPAASKRRLGGLLSPEQLDALETRRSLIVGHFDGLIGRQGDGAVLYDLRRSQSRGTPGQLQPR